VWASAGAASTNVLRTAPQATIDLRDADKSNPFDLVAAQMPPKQAYARYSTITTALTRA